MDNNILRLNIPPEPNLDPNTVCKTYPALTQRQYNLCRLYPDVVASAIQGIQVALYECQFQLKGHRWNCSSLEKKNKNPHASPLLGRGYKETAFAYAISAAGVTHQVAKACSLGKLKSCGCDMSLQGKAVIRNVQKKCKCHGMSGSCEIQTCWKATPEFREVGHRLKLKYNQAAKVQVSLLNAAFTRFKRIRKQYKRTDLMYYEKSPNYCDPNPDVDSPGTSGRLCNKTSNGVDNCETLCCGRGYNTLRVRRSERCNCKFHWCCYVLCDVCNYNEWVTLKPIFKENLQKHLVVH
ncbi:hypothetical protein KUTeg_002159 [Tegillarca granosa]|uniref:Protein Wnt n=1 Tax=Tegillarca granosa TaxID=220873 RepID=A0ABQ9FTJ9_TEGGR|nr:hypothetical protein KUTeg_002159 [Tegillarca granosa]